jgi:hypothetical protein
MNIYPHRPKEMSKLIKISRSAILVLEMQFVGPLCIGLGPILNILVPHMYIMNAMHQNEHPSILNIYQKLVPPPPAFWNLPSIGLSPIFDMFVI